MRETAFHNSNARTLGSLFKRLRKDRGGVAAIEFVLCAFPFFALFLAIIETAILFTAGIVLESGVQGVARQILTGQLQSAGDEAPTKEEFKQLVCDRIDYFLACDKIQVDLKTFDDYSAIDLSYDPDGFGYDLGGSEDINVLRVFYEWEWQTSMLHALSGDDNGKLTFASVAAFRNEPF
ncbi:TadE-like protein [Fulvimarina pelagi HTCC2506]|uniref:TadE-like protein n=1 Tax=Fulvimarina pelagi HTCC2506 TaxID=314231 RepID=Q0G0Z0_9HYPH|nr:TadE/TadG family type IV pilus assembly protein [Fulvimarina pelagi]EAU40849.1 TadE-like protein [Fulvimarina pelagi HTCC2506]